MIPEQLRLWEEKWPGCNWGVVASQVRVDWSIDVDTNPQKGKTVKRPRIDDLDLDVRLAGDRDDDDAERRLPHGL
jgi:hypothetical protein